MGILWDFHEVSSELYFYRISIGFLWVSHGMSMRHIDYYGISTRCQWYFYVIPMGFQKDVYGVSIGFLWDFRDASTIFLWDYFGIPEGIDEIFLGFLWDSFGSSMIFL